ncbi:MAG: DNA N-6-adenine-methyltransferase [Candidatus Latescibacterota bacterium]|jgi:site-specific DNA-methyltransferase (adenine-specific)
MTKTKDGGRKGPSRDDWETPMVLFSKLDEEFHFTVDAAATAATAKCTRFWSPGVDRLKQKWDGEVVWCNPPYGDQLPRWMRKAFMSCKQGATVVMLVPPRTDTAWWHYYAMSASEIRFIVGRVSFLLDGQPWDGNRHPSCLVIFRPGRLSLEYPPVMLSYSPTCKWPALPGLEAAP